MHLPKASWRRLADVPIYAKVSLAPGLILIVLLLLSLASLRMLNIADTHLRAISERAFPTYQRAAETKDAVNAIQTALQHTLSVAANESDAARIVKVVTPVHQAIARATAAFDLLRRQIGAQSEVATKQAKFYGEYQAAAAEVLKAAESDPATATMLMTDVDELFANLTVMLDGTKSQADTASQTMSREAIEEAGVERLVLLASLTVALIICIGIMIAISHAIGAPIMRLTGRMAAMADDDLDRDIPALDRGDEIGAMARAVDVFRGNGLRARENAAEREQEQAAKLRHQAAMSQHTHDFGTSISGVMTSLGGSAEAMRYAAAAMTEVATQVLRQAGTTADGAAKASIDLSSVAAAVEQLSASVDEISRRVAAAAAIAHEAVRSTGTGQSTMRDMAQAASRIGDVGAADQRHRGPNQSPGVERDHRGRPCR